MKTVVLDMHGIIFSFSKNNNVNESGDLLDSKIQELEKNLDKFKGAMQNDKIYLEAEFEVVKDILQKKIDMNIYEMPHAIKFLLEYYKEGYKILIVSTSKVESSKMILEYLFKLNKIDNPSSIIKTFEIYNTDDYDSKSKVETWQQIFSKYQNIDIIFEDKKQYNQAAKKAANNLGFKPQCFRNL